MIQKETLLKVADNTGAKILNVFNLPAGKDRRYARIGDIVTASIREATPHSGVKKGDIVQAVIVRQRKEIRRSNGMYVRFDDNAAVIIDPKSKEPKGTRIFGPIARELKAKGFNKIISLAPEVL